MAHSEAESAQSWAWIMDPEPQGEGNYASTAFFSVQDIIGHGLTLPPSDPFGLGAEVSNVPRGPPGTEAGTLRKASLTYLLCHDGYQPSETLKESPELTKLSFSAGFYCPPSIEEEQSTGESPATTWTASCQCPSDNHHRTSICGPPQSAVPRVDTSGEDIQLRIQAEEFPSDQSRSQQVWAANSNVSLYSDNHSWAGINARNSSAKCFEDPIGDGTRNPQSPGRATVSAQQQSHYASPDVPLPSIESNPPNGIQPMFMPALETSGGGAEAPKNKNKNKTKNIGGGEAVEFGVSSGLFQMSHVHPAKVNTETGLSPLATREIDSRGSPVPIVDHSKRESQTLLTDLPLPLAITIALSEPLQRLNTIRAVASVQALFSGTSTQQPRISSELRRVFDQIFARWEQDDEYRKQLLLLIMEKLQESKKRTPCSLGPTKREKQSLLDILNDLDIEHSKLRLKDKAELTDSEKVLIKAMGLRRLNQRCKNVFKDMEDASQAVHDAKGLEKMLQQQAQTIENLERRNHYLTLETKHRKDRRRYYKSIALGTTEFSSEEQSKPEDPLPEDFKPQKNRLYSFSKTITNPYWRCLLINKETNEQCLGLNQSFIREKRSRGPVWINRIKCSACLQLNDNPLTQQFISPNQAVDFYWPVLSRSMAKRGYSLDMQLEDLQGGFGPDTASTSAIPLQYYQHPHPPQFSPYYGHPSSGHLDTNSIPPHSHESWRMFTPAPREYRSPYPQRGPALTMDNAPVSGPSPDLQGGKTVGSQPQPAAPKFRARGADPGVLTLPTVPQTVIRTAESMLANHGNITVARANQKRPAPGGEQHAGLRPFKRSKPTNDAEISTSTTDAVRVALPGTKRAWMPNDRPDQSEAKGVVIVNDDDTDGPRAHESPVNPVGEPAAPEEVDASCLSDGDGTEPSPEEEADADLLREVEAALEIQRLLDLEEGSEAALGRLEGETPEELEEVVGEGLMAFAEESEESEED